MRRLHSHQIYQSQQRETRLTIDGYLQSRYHIKRRHYRLTGFKSIYKNLWADDYGSNDAPDQSIDSTILILFYLYLFSTALTTPLNLGGCVTDYRYHVKTSFVSLAYHLVSVA